MTLPLPAITPLNAPYWDAIKHGRLAFQHCTDCGYDRLPPASACPRCLGENAEWQAASGRGRIVSFVVYHHAFHDHFAGKLPYNVALVELAEGPRLITNIVNPDAGLAIDKPVTLVIETEDGLAIPRFRLET